MCMKRMPQIVVVTPLCTNCLRVTVMQRIQEKTGIEYRIMCPGCGKVGPSSLTPKIAARMFVRDAPRHIAPRFEGFYCEWF